ncbi:MAG: histidinol-phosphate transaminase [Methanotrichaceae archaeon]|nr:histidinol-phosphate transaminase [Methanotrichaceae archaeon]
MKDYSHILIPYIQELEPDEAGPDPSFVSAKYGIPLEKIIILSRNENPFGPSPKVLKVLNGISLNRYPNPTEFIEALSIYSGYPVENIVVGAGMDEVITTITRLFLKPGDESLIPSPTYGYYSNAVKLCGALPIYLKDNFSFHIGTEVLEKVKIIFLCSPNNPTGSVMPEKTICRIAESTEAIIFLDEAYVEFAEKHLIKLVEKYDNLIVGRTLSKAFGLAGLRLGYAIAPELIAKQYRCVAPLFSISSPSLAAGVAALKDLSHMRKSVAKIISERNRLLNRIRGACPSQANFLFIKTAEKSKKVTERLLSQGVIIRDCSSFPGCGDHCIRVTVGTTEENNRFLELFAQH